MTIDEKAKQKIRDMIISSELEHVAEIDPEKYREFLLHECPYSMNQGDIGGRLTYCYTPTTIGSTIEVKCACGQTENITDYDGW